MNVRSCRYSRSLTFSRDEISLVSAADEPHDWVSLDFLHVAQHLGDAVTELVELVHGHLEGFDCAVGERELHHDGGLHDAL